MKADMASGFYFGSAGSNIQKVYAWNKGYFTGRGLLITCLDSGDDLLHSSYGEWRKYLCKKRIVHQFVGSAVYVSAESMEQLFAEAQTFSHFDEVYWLKPGYIPDRRPAGVFTSDGFDFQDRLPNEFCEAFEEIQAEHYFSDGLHLNYATRSKGLAKALAVREDSTPHWWRSPSEPSGDG